MLQDDCSKIVSNVNEGSLLFQETSQKFPLWLHHLFFRLSVIYDNLWLSKFRSESIILAKKAEWYLALQSFDQKHIVAAIDRCCLLYSFPPSIKEFSDLCRSEKKKEEFVSSEKIKKFSDLHENCAIITVLSDEALAARNKIFKTLGMNPKTTEENVITHGTENDLSD